MGRKSTDTQESVLQHCREAEGKEQFGYFDSSGSAESIVVEGAAGRSVARGGGAGVSADSANSLRFIMLRLWQRRAH
jgi:hypothetical protein